MCALLLHSDLAVQIYFGSSNVPSAHDTKAADRHLIRLVLPIRKVSYYCSVLAFQVAPYFFSKTPQIGLLGFDICNFYVFWVFNAKEWSSCALHIVLVDLGVVAYVDSDILQQLAFY